VTLGGGDMTASLRLAAIYALFFLSGAAALVYQVVWVRSLTQVFGGSHQAVTAVLGIFMVGLALGGYTLGRLVDRIGRPLHVYGVLELGIAGSALAFMGLMRIYPALYVPLAQGRDDSIVYLTAVRTAFALVALIVPTTLMGGTLPVLSRFVSRRLETLGTSLSFLYGLNTLGAVFGALLAGFVLLRLYSVTATVMMTVATNTLIGLISIALQAACSRDARRATPEGVSAHRLEDSPLALAEGHRQSFASRIVLWGIGISGFCALGYEVLWTRILTLAVGASVYGFTIMLVAFLTGIALGSKVYGLVTAILWPRKRAGDSLVITAFGIVQVMIGITALLVTVFLRDVPVNAVRIQGLFLQSGVVDFAARQWSSFALAFLYMMGPAFLMGIAFPLAGEVHVRRRQTVGSAVGEVLAYNTVGAVLGAWISGFALIYLFGIERSLEMLVVVNVGTGLVVLGSLRGVPAVTAAVAALPVAAVGVLVANPTALKVWDTSYFAIFRSNQPDAFATPEMVREAVENTDVLYYAEGVESIVSVIQLKGGEPAFLTNGRVEASGHLKEQQCQLTLGHLPMLLARHPKNVLVVGLGSGMTLGATSVHPSVEQVTLAEIERKVLGVARTFAAYNHRVLESPKLRTIFNDGRNFLMTTNQKFDVITADPIHPWFRGAGYLYTTQYFKLAADHLNPGGVMAQWLPIYELTPDDLRSVVRTFRAHFTHTLMWLTHYDAELIGSNSPLVLDETELARRMTTPAVASDLERVMMGSPTDLLSYFVMGTTGMERFGQQGVLNTDDRLYLEFSAPFSMATPAVMEANVRALSADRESLLPYLVPAGPAEREAQRRRWDLQRQAAKVVDPALALFLGGKSRHPEITQALGTLERQHPSYAPGRFLRAEYEAAMALEPRLLQAANFTMTDDRGDRLVVEISAVLVPVSRTRAAIMFIDNQARFVYGQRYVDDYERTPTVSRLVDDVMAAVDAVYRKEAGLAMAQRKPSPPAARTLPKMHDAIASKVRGGALSPKSNSVSPTLRVALSRSG
jgi:spermidine synthase